MKKYLVDVYIPAIGKHYDTFLPANKKINEVTYLLAGIAESLSRGSYKGIIKIEDLEQTKPDKNQEKNTVVAILLDARTGKPLTLGDTVHDAGIRNSSKILLV